MKNQWIIFTLSLKYVKYCSLIVISILLLSSPFSVSSKEDILSDLIAKSHALQQVSLIPRSEFIKDNDPFGSVKLSPDGRYLSYIVKHNNKQQLWMRDNATGLSNMRFTSTMMRGIYWAGDSQSLFLHLKAGVAVLKTSAGARPEIILQLNTEQYFYGPDKGSSHHFYIWQKELKAVDKNRRYVLYRVDYKGNLEYLYTSDEIVDFYALPSGPVKFISMKEPKAFKIYELHDDKNKRQVYACHFTDYCRLLSFASSTNTLYVIGRGAHDLSRLIALDMVTGEKTTIHHDPENRFDIDSVIFDNISGLPLMASYEADYFKNYGLTDTVNQHLHNIEAHLNSSIISITPNVGSNYWLVRDLNPNKINHQIFLYHIESGLLIQPLLNMSTRLSSDLSSRQDNQLAVRVAIEYEASDGMILQGYVTLPRGAESTSVSLVVVAHGGPFSRRTGNNTKLAQFLANRGHAVFEPNFRASKGFGRKYMQSAMRDFGNGRVQRDIIDGLEYLLSQGIGDRNKLAITGGSFGGFATLTALTFTPELFKVGIAVSPPSALSNTARYLSKDLKGNQKIEMLERFAHRIVDINDPIDTKRSYQKSPEAHVDKVKQPIYLIAGEKDRRVSILNVRDYALRLEAAGKRVTLLSAPHEGHIYSNPIAVEAWYYILEKALFDHAGGRMQQDISPKVHRFLSKNIVIKPSV